jgi:hypothetical protein
VARQWSEGSVYGATGTMTEQFIAGSPGRATFRIMFERRGNQLAYNLAVDTLTEHEDDWVLTGDCRPPAR